MYHIPIMLNSVTEALKVKKGGLYLDGTLGGGGHSEAILLNGGNIIGIDRDDEAIAECTKRFGKKEFSGRFSLIKDNFKNAKAILDDRELDGALLDLGISSHQIDEAARGMSYRFDSPLDMRMDRTQYLTAATVINEYPQADLIRILFEYGEERFAKRIAANILAARAIKPIATTGEFAEIVRKSIPKGKEMHPEKRSFQAVRIEVNNELRGLDSAVESIFQCLKKGGRLCVITFHSLEDRIVKQTFKRLSEDCICDKSLPKCVCGHRAEGKIIAKLTADKKEIEDNPRSACATLRIIERI